MKTIQLSSEFNLWKALLKDDNIEKLKQFEMYKIIEWLWKVHLGFNTETFPLFKLYNQPTLRILDENSLNQLILEFHWKIKEVWNLDTMIDQLDEI